MSAGKMIPEPHVPQYAKLLRENDRLRKEASDLRSALIAAEQFQIGDEVTLAITNALGSTPR